LFELLEAKDGLRLLDLGCGVGRNSIPLAQRLLDSEGKVDCVDLLASAIRHLERYGKEYGVTEALETHLEDIGAFEIEPDSYHYILSISSLEHVDSMATFDRVLSDMMKGTRDGGIHCFIINAGVKEKLALTGEPLDPMFELLLGTEELLRILAGTYKGWELLKQTVKPYEMMITRDGQPVILQSDVVTWAARKRASGDCRQG
jgi:tellurite methyltransferase